MIKIDKSRIRILDSNCHVIIEKVTDFCAIITDSCHVVAMKKQISKASLKTGGRI